MKKKFSSLISLPAGRQGHLSSPRGFTLIELLVVIAIVGILAVGLIATIDPVDKINAGNDSKVFNDISLMSKAAETYAASNNGAYPTSAAVLTASGELRSVPTAPTGYTYTPTYSATAFTMTGTLKSKKYTAQSPAKVLAVYNSSNGKLCDAVAGTTVCP